MKTVAGRIPAPEDLLPGDLMLFRDRASWALAILLSMTLLIAPALWNGFPLLQWDSGGYIARWYQHSLMISRSTVYGLFLTAGDRFAFWPELVVQAAAAVWVLALTLRAHGLGNRPFALVAIVAALTATTSLPWLASMVLTDIFAGVGAIAFYLLLMQAGALARWERIALVLLVAFSAATHSATLAVLIGLLVCAAIVRRLAPARIPAGPLGNGAFALALGAMLVFAGNYIVARQIAWTPGGFALSFGRMLQDGIVDAYLDAHCPDPHLRLCKVKDQLPHNADEFFWKSKLFEKLGKFDGLGKEMEHIAFGALVEFPLLQIESIVKDTAEQIVDVRTGEGVENVVWHSYGIIKDNLPQLVPAMQAARQQQRPYGLARFFPWLNKFHYPIALGAMALLPLIVICALAGWLPFGIGEFAAVCMLAILGNAFVCGVLSNPHDRYGSRVVWLAGFAAVLALARAVAALRRPVARPAPEPIFY